jgi:hypothetical protein
MNLIGVIALSYVSIRVRSSRIGIDDQAAKLLVERSIRRDQGWLFVMCRHRSSARFVSFR